MTWLLLKLVRWAGARLRGAWLWFFPPSKVWVIYVRYDDFGTRIERSYEVKVAGGLSVEEREDAAQAFILQQLFSNGAFGKGKPLLIDWKMVQLDPQAKQQRGDAE